MLRTAAIAAAAVAAVALSAGPVQACPTPPCDLALFTRAQTLTNASGTPAAIYASVSPLFPRLTAAARRADPETVTVIRLYETFLTRQTPRGLTGARGEIDQVVYQQCWLS